MNSKLSPEAVLVAAKLRASLFPSRWSWNISSWTFCVICGAPTQNPWACHKSCYRPNQDKVDFRYFAANKSPRFALNEEEEVAIKYLVKP